MSNDPLDRDAVREALQGLVRIDSQNPVLVPGAPGERGIAEYCRDYLLERGVEAWLEEAAPARWNAVARIGAGSGPTLAFCAHLDTVSVEGMTIPPFAARCEDGRVYGRGAYDMKGGVAAILCALVELARRPLQGTVLAALVCDEEYASIGAADFVQRHPCDACIVTEPSEERLILAHKGFVWAELGTRGVAAHGSRWDLGVSAIAPMARAIHALEEFDRAELRTRTHPLLGPASLHCAMVQGGEGWSTYAERCTLRVERRTLPGETPEQVMHELRQLLERAGVEASVERVLSRSPLECSPESRLARSARLAAAAVYGREPEVAGVGYWMDTAIFAEAGAETVNFGAGGEGAHGAVEWVDLESVQRSADVLVRAAVAYLGEPA